MAWIESHQGLANHPKTKRLVRRLDISVPLAIGHLHCLWWWALDFAQDGEITQYDAFDIADACQWRGQAEHMHDALIEAGFIDLSDERKFLHDWYDYAGKLIEIRRKDAERKRNSRGNPKLSSGHPADIQRTSEGVRAESIRDLNLNQNQKNNNTVVSDETDRVSIPFPDIINYLNQQAGTNYRASGKSTQRHISARWNEGYRMEHFQKVVDTKCAEWKGGEMEKYLSPDTLFGTKFEKYLNQRFVVHGGRSVPQAPLVRMTEEEKKRYADLHKRQAELNKPNPASNE